MTSRKFGIFQTPCPTLKWLLYLQTCAKCKKLLSPTCVTSFMYISLVFSDGLPFVSCLACISRAILTSLTLCAKVQLTPYRQVPLATNLTQSIVFGRFESLPDVACDNGAPPTSLKIKKNFLRERSFNFSILKVKI